MPAKSFTCPTCGKITTKYIYPNKPASDYCSLECRYKANTKECQCCGKKFRTKASDIHSAKYCSPKCYHKCQTIGKTTYKHICEFCSKPFVSARAKSRFCSKQCTGKRRKRNPYQLCKFCGKEFYTRPSHLRLYCSNECYKADNATKPKICQKCGIEFVNYANDVFCSKACRDDRVLRGVVKNCLECGIEFYVTPTHIEKTFFCSRHCRLAHRQSSIERSLCSALDALSIVYNTQVKIGRFWIDIVLPEYKIAIECDGDYWHSLPENILRDKRKNDFLKSVSWMLVRFSEKEINDNAHQCAIKIESLIHNR